MIELSICVPTFNRAKELNVLLRSVPQHHGVEVVICDDGSQDGTAAVVDAHRTRLSINYFCQPNAGRASALRKAVAAAKGRYSILMDSDDYFLTGGVEAVLSRLDEDYDALVFGVQIKRGERAFENLPPAVISNFISLRADYGVRGDLKEVVRTELMQKCMYDVQEGVRRVPTYLLWSQVAEQTHCKCVPLAIATKEYLPGGLTANILFNKTRNAEPMVLLFDRLSNSSMYTSRLYRWRSRIQWARYSLHSARGVAANVWWKWVVLVPAYGLYVSDLLRLKRSRR